VQGSTWEPVIIFTANPDAEPAPGGYDPQSGDVQSHRQFLARFDHVLWDIVSANHRSPHISKQLERVKDRIRRGYIYVAGKKGTHGAVKYEVDIAGMHKTLKEFPAVPGLPNWRSHYSPDALQRLYWLDITRIEAVAPFSPRGLHKESDGVEYQGDYILGYLVIRLQTSCNSDSGS
jgi:hypothetical protein